MGKKNLCKENIPAFLNSREELMVWMELFSSPCAQNPNHDMGKIEKHPLGTFRGQTCTKNPFKTKGQAGFGELSFGKGSRDLCLKTPGCWNPGLSTLKRVINEGQTLMTPRAELPDPPRLWGLLTQNSCSRRSRAGDKALVPAGN